ncbi:MAG: hypothetical protein KJ000_28285 [Pirellulaceae bacterium]|nr:hypothetical protein [Pirellulaceae bacterium]
MSDASSCLLRRRSRRHRSLRRRTPVWLEPLEPRWLLDGAFWLAAMKPLGAADRPFDRWELTFSEAVDETTLDTTGVRLNGPGGDLHPLVLTPRGDNRYEADFGGQTAKTNYALTVGPDIESAGGQPLDQNRDGTPGDGYTAALFASGVTIPEGDGTYDGQSLILYGSTSTINGPHSFADMQILGGATLTHSAATATQEYRLELDVSDSLIIDATSKIDVSGRGYLPWRTLGNTTTGAAAGASGGSYGGYGNGGTSVSQRTNEVYGDFRQPNELGSGGAGQVGYPAAGGGLVRIESGTLTLEGAIRANGANGSSASDKSGGGGSGGAVYLDVGTLAGGGTISADGGSNTGFGRAGGGGRVAVYYAALSGFDQDKVLARGGTSATGSGHGAVGTVYLEQRGGASQLILDSHGRASGAWTPLSVASGTTLAVDRLEIAGPGVAVGPADGLVFHAPEIDISGGASFEVATPQPTDTAIVATTLNVTGGSSLTHRAASDSREYSLRITADAILIDATSKIDVSGRGYLPWRTLGNTTTGAAAGGSGGSYGGYGNGGTSASQRTNDVYGDFRQPNELGSGGAGQVGYPAAGGGLVRIESGTLTLEGAIRANGANGSSASDKSGGGGSGGAVYLDVGTLAGGGTISADGGSNTGFGRAGGGGRVAVYYAALSGFDQDKVLARGGTSATGSGHGAVGTVYLEQRGGASQLILDSHGRTSGAWTPLSVASGTTLAVDRLEIAGPGVAVAPADALVFHSPEIDISGGASFEVATQQPTDTAIVATTMNVTGGSTLTHRAASTSREYSLRITADTIVIDATSKIDVSGLGYLSGRTVGNTTVGGATGNAGGSYGGLGAGNTTNALYGDPANPKSPGSGGAGNWSTPGGEGGGAVILHARTLTLDGVIRADGAGVAASGFAGAGSGGSVRIGVGALEGEGTISAGGGNVTVGTGSGGGGGRIAVYAWDRMNLPMANIAVRGGTGPGGAGGAGTVEFPTQPLVEWDWPQDAIWHGAELFGWSILGRNPAEVTVSLDAYAPWNSYSRPLGPVSNFVWDTTTVPDGRYEIRLTLRDVGGTPIGQFRRENVLINNSVVWHEGAILADETWDAAQVHAVENMATVGAGVALTIEPGAVVKLVPGACLVVANGGILHAPATWSAPIVVTLLADDTVGGDTNLDGPASHPRFGDSLGISLQGTGQAHLTEHVQLRYFDSAHSGTIATDQVWPAWQLHRITGDLTVPEGVTLTIQPGAVVKFAAGAGIVVETGAELQAQGTLAQRIVFTSIRDDTAGGDTNGDGSATAPLAGDWESVRIQGQGSLTHAEFRYGGNSIINQWGAGGMVEVSNGRATLDACIILESLKDGLLAVGTVDVTNSLLLRNDRGIAAAGSVRVVNSTLDDNRIGILAHGGTLHVNNTLVTNSLQYGIDWDFGGNAPVVRYTNVWGSGTADFHNHFDQPDPVPGVDGILSADPRYRDAARGDFRLRHDSPAIDAADDSVAPLTDAAGAPRFDDSWVPNRMGGYADLGAFEFVANAPGAVDLVPSLVSGPITALAGDHVVLQWKITNSGTGTATGPWHDRIGLVPRRDSDAPELVAANVLVGHGTVLGPGQDLVFTVEVPVPGGVAGDYNWRVTTNAKADVFEGSNCANNVALSSGTVALDVPRLALGDVVSGMLSAGEDRYFRLDVPEGADLEIAVQGADPTTVGLRVGYRSMPSAWDSADLDGFPNSGQTVWVRSARPGEYYVLLHGNDTAAVGAAYQLAARIVSNEITNVRPSQGSNRGEVTVELTAFGLPTAPTIAIVAADGTRREAHRIWQPDLGTVWATFDLRGLATGRYDIRMEGESVVQKEGAFEVTAGAAGRVVAHLSGPEILRAGRGGQITITYENDGHTDVPAPLLVITANNAELAPTASLRTPIVMRLGIGSSGPSGILRPGERASFTLPFVPIGLNRPALRLETLTADSPLSAAAVDWLSLKDGLKPSYAPSAAWDVVFDNFVAAIGTTGGQVLASLGDIATHLSQLGRRVSDVETLIAFAIQGAAGFSPVDLLAAAVDAIQPAPGVDLFFGRGYFNGIARRQDMGPLGWGWRHTWELDLQFQPDGSVLVPEASGTVRRFVPDGAGGYLSSIDHPDGLRPLAGGGYELSRGDGSLVRYDANGRFASLQSLDGNQMVPAYDAQGRLERIDHSSGGFLEIAYNAFGRVASVTDARGQTTSFGYDPTGEYLVSSTDPQGRIVEYTYDPGTDSASGRALRSVRQPDGTTQYFEYDARGRLASQYTNGQGARIDFQYGPSGEVRLITPGGDTTVYDYDEFGRLARVRNASGSTRSYAYDQQGRLREIVDALGGRTSYAYDANGNLASVLDAAGNVVQYSYGMHPVPQPDSVTDAAGNTVTYAYDEHGLRVRRIMSDGTAETFNYNNAGQVVRWVNRRGQTIDYEYSATGLLTGKRYADGTEFTYAYDTAGRLIEATGPVGAVLRQYDDSGRLARIEYPGGHFLAYTYDDAGRRRTTADELGNALTAHYDSLGRLERLADENGLTVVAYSYDALNRLVQKELGNGVYTVYAYTATGAIERLTNHAPGGSILSSYDYDYDALGQIVSIVSADGTWTYGYDLSGQLVSANFTSTNTALADQQIQYLYDAAGNRIRIVSNGLTESYEPNALYQYIRAGQATYVYDSDGNLVSKTEAGATTTFTYNAENRLVRIDGGAGTTVYAYDALGRLASVTEDAQTRYFVTDPFGAGAVAAEFDAAGNLLTRYDNAAGLLRSERASGELRYFTFQFAGHSSELTDAIGQVTDAYAYSPFGTTLYASGDTDNPFQYVGEYGVMTVDADLLMMQNRFYSPTTGQFLSEDPLGYDGVNNRIYVGNSPIDGIDPAGLGFWGDVWNATKAVAGMAANASLFVAGVATSKLGIGVPAAIYGGYGFVSNATNFIRALKGEEPLSNGGFFGDAGKLAAHYTGVEALETAGNGVDIATALVDPTKAAAKLPDWFAKSKKALDLVGTSSTASCLIASSIDSAVVVVDHFTQESEELTKQGKKLIVMEHYGTIQPILKGSIDPNEMIGPAGVGEERFVADGTSLFYTIVFENLPAATAPAQEVFITQQLDPGLDFGTLSIQQFGFGDTVVDVPANLGSFQQRLDLRDSLGMFLDVSAHINTVTGRMTWTFRAILPLTGDLPEDPLAGFLPPNDQTGRGEGFVTFTVRPRSGLPTGTVIGNDASIVFDVNEPIITNQVINTLDAGVPTSQVASLAALSAHQFWVTWAGEDEGGAGSGVAAYDVYVSDDEGPYTRWLENTAEMARVFTGQLNHAYRFYSVSVDNVGHREAAPGAPDAHTQVARIGWRNPWNPFDIDGDGFVIPLDVLRLINYINAQPGDPTLPPPPAVPPYYYDVDDDGFCIALDVLQLINHINDPTAEAAGESEVWSGTVDPAVSIGAELPGSAWVSMTGQHEPTRGTTLLPISCDAGRNLLWDAWRASRPAWSEQVRRTKLGTVSTTEERFAWDSSQDDLSALDAVLEDIASDLDAIWHRR